MPKASTSERTKPRSGAEKKRMREARAIERRYYLAMAAPFVLDVAVSAIFCAILELPDAFLRNLVTALPLQLVGGQVAARLLFLPIKRFLAGGRDFATIERRLTQLPLRSASVSFWLYLPVMAFRLFTPLIVSWLGDAAALEGVPVPTLLDACVTLVVQVLFIFVVVYFLVSAYLDRLCQLLFRRHGVNLSLFFGRFALKTGVALVFSAVAPLALIAGDIMSYDGDRMLREVAVDLVASVFGLGVALYWVTRALNEPLARLSAGVARVAEGDLGVRLPVTSNEEIGELTHRFNRMVEGLRERQQIRETFGKYVSESVASQLLAQAGDGRLGGEVREATLLFTDIQGSTTLSEGAPPDLVISVLNEYLEAVLAPIARHGGVVNGFTGDGLFASFNLPLANPNHAASAIAAAIEIQRITESRAFGGRVKLPTRIGINTGPVVGGTVGAGDRLGYTLLGDAVNTAARLEELNKTYGTRILISAATRAQAGDGFRFVPLGEAPIRGRRDTLEVFTVETEALVEATPAPPE